MFPSPEDNIRQSFSDVKAPDMLPGELPFDGDRLPEEDEAELELLVETYLGRAIGDKSELEERAKRWRDYISLKRYRDVPYEGAPDISTPVIRQKADGVKAHLFASIDQQPMFVLDPRTERAQQASPYLESLMTTVMESTDSREEILKAVRDAVEVGTGHLKHVIIQDGNGRKVPASRYVPFEDVYVWPSTITRPEYVNYFERYREPRYSIKEKSERGIYWEDKVKNLLEGNDEIDMNEEETVWECWVRYKGDFYEVRYHEREGVLSYRKSEWAAFIGRAPYDPIYIEQSQTSYWGDSISQILEGLQEVSDRAFNIELARGQFTMNPPILVNASSPVYQHLMRSGMWEPGEVIPASNDPRMDIHIPMQQLNPFDMQLLQITQRMAEEATINDMLIPGQAMGGRKTATEVNMITSVGALKLRNYLSAVSSALKRHANSKWSLIALYVLKNEALSATSEFKWIVNGRETVPEQQNRLAQVQYLLNPQFLQMMQLAAQNPFLQEVLIAFLSYLDLPGLGAAFRRLMRGQAAAALQANAFGLGGVQGVPGGAFGAGQQPIG